MGREPVAREPPLALLLTAGALGRNGLEKNTEKTCNQGISLGLVEG